MSKIRESARGEACQIRIPHVCTGDRETVVFCHANGISIGKGIGEKSHDILGAYGCLACHMIYDRMAPLSKELQDRGLTREEVEISFWRGMARTLLILLEKGLVAIA